MINKGHNCNLCKNAKYFSGLGNICLGKKHRGKVVELNVNNVICNEYEFGGFIELAKAIKKILSLKDIR